MSDMDRSYQRALALAALCGFKIALGPAFLKTARRQEGAAGWVAAALGEMFLDKVGVFPARYKPQLLIPHALAGAWTAHQSLRDDGIDDPWGVAMGAGVAAGVSIALPLLRMAGSHLLGVPDPLLGVAEDYVALRLGSEATGLSMHDVTDAARGSFDEMKGRVAPALQSAAAYAH